MSCQHMDGNVGEQCSLVFVGIVSVNHNTVAAV